VYIKEVDGEDKVAIVSPDKGVKNEND
jgi:hypothetical protein